MSNTVSPPNTPTNDFESIRSTLIWNMSAWPGGQLDRIHDSANYTCQSTDNGVGPGVKSSTAFRVECKYSQFVALKSNSLIHYVFVIFYEFNMAV